MSPAAYWIILYYSTEIEALPEAPETTPNGDNHVIKILLVDDQLAVRDGLRMRLELEPDLTIVGEAYVVVKVQGRVPVKEN